MKYPLVSFCIATYKHPEILRSTVNAILNQEYPNLEIIVSDNDPEGSAGKIINAFNSKKIIYNKNKSNLGMVKNFNKAFSLSSGSFVIILADDDPPTKNMLSIFKTLYIKYPNAKAFLGACYVDITSEKIGEITHLKKGANSFINPSKKYGQVDILGPKEFYRQFLSMRLFPHYLWSAGLFSRDIVSQIKGVPDYGSPHFSDYAFLLKIAAKNNFVAINRELATNSIHEYSYGKELASIKDYEKGVLGFNKEISKTAYQLGYKEEFEKFISKMVIMFLVDRFTFYKRHGYKIDPKFLYNTYKDLGKKLTFLKKNDNELYLRLYFYFPFNKAYNLLNYIKDRK